MEKSLNNLKSGRARVGKGRARVGGEMARVGIKSIVNTMLPHHWPCSKMNNDQLRAYKN